MNFTPEQVAAMCREYGPQTGPLPPGVDGKQLLWALSGVESSHGLNCTPRHEPAFDVGGKYAKNAPMPALLARYGTAAACSYGPLQIMLCNAQGLGPQDFDNIDQAFHASVSFLNNRLFHYKPQDLAEIGEMWNAGSIRPDPDYVAKLTANYAIQIPEVNQ